MNINEDKNHLNKATFNCETTLSLIVLKTIWSTVYLDHSTLSQSELIQVFFITCSCNACEPKLLLLFNSKTNSLLTALFSAIVLSMSMSMSMYVYSGHALSYTKLVHRHATQTEGNKFFK